MTSSSEQPHVPQEWLSVLEVDERTALLTDLWAESWSTPDRRHLLDERAHALLSEPFMEQLSLEQVREIAATDLLLEAYVGECEEEEGSRATYEERAAAAVRRLIYDFMDTTEWAPSDGVAFMGDLLLDAGRGVLKQVAFIRAAAGRFGVSLLEATDAAGSDLVGEAYFSKWP